MSSMKRALQYAGLSALGLSKKIVKGKSLNQALNRAMARKMTGMKGVPLKISQILGMSDNESSELYRQAQEEIEPLSAEEIKDILKEESPSLLENSTLHENFLCASLGQVCHMTKDNLEIAVKVKYPDTTENMSMDEKAMSLVSSCFQNFSKGFDMEDYKKVLSQELSQELDYEREIEIQHEYYRIFSDNRDIIIPLSLKKYSSNNCLAMSWEPSMSLDEFLGIASESQRKDASRLIADFYLTSIFHHGYIHADPNTGNFGFRLTGDKVQLVVYDFGSVIKLNKDEHLHLLYLFDLCLGNENPLPALVKLGFDEHLLLPVKDKLPALFLVLLEPFLSDGAFEFESWDRKQKVTDILGDDRWNFMTSAPAELFLFMRSLYGLFYYSGKLSGKIYCLPKIKTSLERFSSGLRNIKVSSSFAESSTLSTCLIISVKENGTQKVKLTLPLKAIENLSSFIPPDVKMRLEDKKIKLEELVSNVRQKLYKPQNIFSLCEGEKEVSVYLE